MTDFKPKAAFDSTHFMKRELRILKDIVSRYDICNAQEMIYWTHIEEEPWHRVWEKKIVILKRFLTNTF